MVGKVQPKLFSFSNPVWSTNAMRKVHGASILYLFLCLLSVTYRVTGSISGFAFLTEKLTLSVHLTVAATEVRQ